MPPFLSILWMGLGLAAVGWGGLLVLIFTTLPTLGPRWLFFFFLTLAISGLVLPAAHFLHRRFPSTPPAGMSALVRESLLTAISVDVLAWLQMGNFLTTPVALLIAFGALMIEFLFRVRERSQFRTGGE